MQARCLAWLFPAVAATLSMSLKSHFLEEVNPIVSGPDDMRDSTLAPALAIRTGDASPTPLVLWGSILLITVIGAALRCYRLGDQSVWLDEFLSVAMLPAESAGGTVRLLSLYFPEHAQCPVFYATLHHWARLVGTSLVELRLLPVILGVATIPMVYLFARHLFVYRVALVAALCYALSPQHVWHAQELRQYCLSVPLVILALYTLLRALEERRMHWWVLNLAINLLLVWTHALHVFVLLVQGLYMLVLYREMFWRMTVWGTVQLALLMPWTYWLLSGPYRYSIPGGADFGEVFNNLFLDEIVRFHSDLLPPYKTNPDLPPSPLAQTLLPMQPYLDALFALVIFAALFHFALLPLWARWGKHPSPSTNGAAPPRTRVWLLLVLLLLVPDLVLGGLSYVFKLQMVGPMYALYATLALYMMLGVLIASLPGRHGYRIGIGALVLLFAYQLALIVPEKTRSDWIGVARHLDTHAAAEDKIFDIQFYGPASYLPYNAPDLRLPIARVWTLESAVEGAATYLAEQDAARPGAQANAWLAYENHLLQMRWANGPQDLLDALKARQLNAERVRFPGHYNAELIRVWKTPGVPVLLEERPVPPVDEQIDYTALLREIGLEGNSPEENHARLHTLHRHVSVWPPVTPFFVFFQADWALADGDLAVAEALQRWTLQQAPSFGLAHFGLGLVLAAQGRPEAEASFNRAFELHRGLDKIFGSYVHALLTEADSSACEKEVDAIEATGYIAFADALRKACQLHADITSASAR